MKTDQKNVVIESCKADAQAQIDCVKEMLARGENSAVIALAAENASKTVLRYCQLNLDGVEYGLA